MISFLWIRFKQGCMIWVGVFGSWIGKLMILHYLIYSGVLARLSGCMKTRIK